MIYVVFFTLAGVPKTLLTPTIITYKKVADGADVPAPPAISEIGGGFYKFSATPSEPLVVTVDGGAALAAADRYKVMQITPHDADLNAPISTRSTLGAGAIAWTYTLTNELDGQPVADANIWVTTDQAGLNTVAAGRTDQNGQVTLYLDAGTVYVWRQKSGWIFVNPDTEAVS